MVNDRPFFGSLIPGFGMTVCRPRNIKSGLYKALQDDGNGRSVCKEIPAMAVPSQSALIQSWIKILPWASANSFYTVPEPR